MMIRASLHPEAMRERAAELETIARRLRSAADGDWPEPVASALIDDWYVGSRAVDTLFGTRVASGKYHASSHPDVPPGKGKTAVMTPIRPRPPTS